MLNWSNKDNSHEASLEHLKQYPKEEYKEIKRIGAIHSQILSRKHVAVMSVIMFALIFIYYFKTRIPASSSVELVIQVDENSLPVSSGEFINFSRLKQISDDTKNILLALMTVEKLHELLMRNNNIGTDMPTYWVMAKQWICRLKKLGITNFVLFVFIDPSQFKTLTQRQDIEKLIYSKLLDVPINTISNEHKSIITFTTDDISKLILSYLKNTKFHEKYDLLYKNYLDQLQRHDNIIPQEFFTTHWEFITLLKPVIVWKCNILDFNIFFSDLDVVIFNNPTHYVHQSKERKNFDVIFQMESCGDNQDVRPENVKINTGVYFVASTHKAQQFLEFWIEPIVFDILYFFVPTDETITNKHQLSRTETTNDQAILNSLITNERKSQKTSIISLIGFFPVRLFPNRCQFSFLVNEHRSEESKPLKDSLILYHINGVWMTRQKIAFLKQQEGFLSLDHSTLKCL
ncbi:hypothetical protein C9374_008047 [Naegleria lovaniensis]|uniref:Nucleotide-diphospho-sugar transferase domain-containing protein n=1 Tax=Naegleria lovaniensis TaxID=51637 RepID=A0AA88KLG9_NAELO|nr:uncharacterized protein C9374_008047 [Naegleria lovaniensis]KAG2378899.1 hypothetical protein C9374_008047 [Naegleria lovaniensis]